MRRTLFAVLAVSLSAGPVAEARSQPGDPRPSAVRAPRPARDGPYDFHLLHGTWQFRDIRLLQPLTGREGLDHLYGTSVIRGVGNGLVSVEQFEGTRADSTIVREAVVMQYDSLARQWSIRRADSAGGELGPPMTGEFRDGTGAFYGQQVHNGRVVLTRLTWTFEGRNKALFARDFSADGGQTWETNRTTAYWRVENAPNDDAPRLPDLASALGGPARRRVIPRVAPIISCCYVLDVLGYSVPPEAEDTLVALFDRGVEAEEDTTTRRDVALFRDIDRANGFVWLRGTPNSTGTSALTSYYHGQWWSALRAVTERAGIRVANAHFLAPARTPELLLGERPARGATRDAGIVVMTRYTLDTAVARRVSLLALRDFFQERITPRLYAAGVRPIAAFQTHHEDPVYTEGVGWHAGPLPGLPMRKQQHEFAWFARFPNVAAYDRAVATLNRDPRWTDLQEVLSELLVGPPEVWRLQPVGRSAPFR
jgi:hypothetical protein